MLAIRIRVATASGDIVFVSNTWKPSAPTSEMADVDVQVQFTTTERKTRKVKKTSKRRESKDGEVTVTEVEQTNTTANADDGYV